MSCLLRLLAPPSVRLVVHKTKAAPWGRLRRIIRQAYTRPSCGLRGLDIADGDLAGAGIFLRVEGNLLAFGQSAHACALESGGVDEYVLAAVVRLNEAKTLLAIVELHGTRVHE